MGCFNATGFFSKLPLQAGDDMVLIFCADMTRACGRDSLPIYVAENYVPINAPIFCQYNDYGSVFENSIVMDANAEFFEKSIGMTCEKLCDLIHDFGNITIEELESKIGEDNEEDEEDEYISEDEKQSEDDFLKLLHLLFDGSYERWRNKIGLVWIMEHKDVYENIAKMGIGPIFNSWGYDDTDIVNKKCENAFSIIKDFPEYDNKFNLLKTNNLVDSIRINEIHKMFEKDANIDFEKAYKEFDKKYDDRNTNFLSTACLEQGALSEAFPTYRQILGTKEWEKYKDNFIQFFRFTRILFALHRIFEPSTYASQEIFTGILSKANEIVYKKSDEICKKYNKRYDDED